MTTHQPTINILVHMLRDPNEYCPSRNGDHIDEKKLFEIAEKNKLQSLLFHFLSCEHCKQTVSVSWIDKINRLQQAMIYRSLVWEKEKQTLDAFLKAHSICGVLFKQCPKILCGSVFTDYQSKSDLDVLVSKSAIKTITNEYTKLGYKLSRKGARKEVQLISPKYRFVIDLHFLIAYPHYSELSEKEYRMVERFTDDLVNSAGRKKYGLVDLPPEWYFIATLIRYWHNDLMTGLRDLYTLFHLAKMPKIVSLWKKIVNLATKYNMKNELFFVLSLGSHIFTESLPKQIQSSIPWWIRLMATSISVNDIAIFPSITKWNNKQNSQLVKSLTTKQYFIKRILNSSIKSPQLLGLRTMAFFITHMSMGIKNYLLYDETK